MALKSKAAELVKKSTVRRCILGKSSSGDLAKATHRELHIAESLGPSLPLNKTPSPNRVIKVTDKKKASSLNFSDLETVGGMTSKRMEETAGRFAIVAPPLLT